MKIFVSKKCLALTSIVFVIASITMAQYEWYNNYCLLNYVPSYCLPYVPNIFQNVFSTLSLSDLGILLQALQQFTTMPNFMNTISSQSAPLSNALNSLNSAYGGTVLPFLQSLAQLSSFRPLMSQLMSGGIQPPLSIPSNFQQLPMSQPFPLAQPQAIPQQSSIQPVVPQPEVAPQSNINDGSAGGLSPGEGPSSGGGLFGFNLGNILQPVVEETQQVVEDTVDTMTEETGPYQEPNENGVGAQQQQLSEWTLGGQ